MRRNMWIHGFHGTIRHYVNCVGSSLWKRAQAGDADVIFIVVAVMGLIAARWLGWFSLVIVSTALAVAVGIEGAVESRSFFKVLKRGFEINATFQGAFLAQSLLPLWPLDFPGRSDR
ncbi:hypothetical protein [Methylobacterium komagatae]